MKMLPNFFVIGAAKCGTTSLSQYLACHPEVHMSAIKETRFFAAPDPTRPFGGPRVERLSDYQSLFRSDAAARGEASPAYSQYPWRTGVPERIHELIPDARFVYLVGDPVTRLVSHYRQAVSQTGQTQPLAQIVLDGMGAAGDVEHSFICAGRYALQVERYLEVFSAAQLLVLDQNELRHDRRAALSRVFAFLDVDPDYWSEKFTLEQNRGAEHRRVSSGVYGKLRASPLHRLLETLPPGARDRLVQSARRAIAPPVGDVALDPDLRRRLEAHYRPEVARLRELTGQRFAEWSL